MSCRELDVGLMRTKTARLSVAGELGYEINVPASEHHTLYRTLMEAGRDLGVVQIGYNALNSLRLEKSFGVWSKEFTWAYTPGMSGMDRFIDFAKPDFIGRDAARKEKDTDSAKRKLVTLDIDATDADAAGFEPIWNDGKRVGFVTSGGYGHTIRKSLAMAYVDRDAVNGPLEVHIVGVKRKCRVVPPSPHDPQGKLLRS
jgi:dimethylglycine dehydrogenase